MKPDIKKLLISNLPYLMFVYLFDKLGQAYRLAAGAAFADKLMHLLDGFAAAFASPAPSFVLFDLCIGIVGAVIIRLAVYVKSRNAKKYRNPFVYIHSEKDVLASAFGARSICWRGTDRITPEPKVRV